MPSRPPPYFMNVYDTLDDEEKRRVAFLDDPASDAVFRDAGGDRGLFNQQIEATKLEYEAADRVEQEAATAEGNATRDATKRRQRTESARVGGRRSTLLTSPLGASDTPQTSRKVLLGS